MRPLEIVITVLLLVFFAVPLLPPARRSRWLEGLPLLAAGLTILHLIIEGYRWQMLPLYLLVAISMLLAAFRLARSRPQPPPAWRRVSAALLGLALVALAAALPVLFPIPQLPAPSGPYSVGVQTMQFTDNARQEIYGPEPGGPRRLMVKIWYPAQVRSGNEPAPWIENSPQVGEAISGWLDLPAFTLDHLQYARTHAYAQAELDKQGAPYPLLLFSHGWGGFRAQNTYQMEELASHGYIVAAVQHTYGAVMTIFPDGSVAAHDPQTLPQALPPAEFKAAANRLAKQWQADLGFVLDTLAAFNTSLDPDPQASMFYDSLDLERVGLLGHSTGGGAAIEFCSQDTRCRALLTMDAYLLPVSEPVFEAGLSQPSLFIFSEYWPSPENEIRFQRLFNQAQGPALDLTLLGGDHYDFSDLPLLSPLAATLGLKGPVDGQQALKSVRDLSVQFFNAYLRGEQAPLLAAPETYFEMIRLEARQEN